jgi:minor extracellular serine protease Vpr
MTGDGPGNEKGIAPKATFAAYKLSSPDLGGFLSTLASFNAFESLIKDKVQVSNNSFGSINGISVGHEANLINNAVLAGCVFVASQANSGSPGKQLQYPGSSTGAPDNAIAVGASDDTDYSSIIVQDTSTEEFKGRKILGNWGMTEGKFKKYGDSLAVVDCGWGRPEDFEGIGVNGKIALILRGPGAYLDNKFGPPLSFKDKNLNASKAGAVMTIIYNYESTALRASYSGSDNKAPLDPNLIPSFEIMRSDGELLKKELHKGNPWMFGDKDLNQKVLTVTITAPENRANLADFTSVGPTVDFKLKPDVCAPGVGIRTCYPAWTKTQYVDDFGGTSAAGPFVAGCAALMVQARPTWNPFEIKRALMNTADLLKRYDGKDFIQLTAQGQGRVNVYDALKTDVLIQPPSALIVADSKIVNVADIPDELKDDSKRKTLPSEVSNSTLPLKLFNYSAKDNKKYEFSFELNSRYPDQIKVEFSDSQIEIPKAKSNTKPGVSWIGVSINFPTNIKGQLNDIIIFATDKATGKKLHVGVCIYSNKPSKNTYVSDIEVSKNIFTPDGDGEDEEIEINYTLTNGSFQKIPDVDFLYTNFSDTLSFYAIDSNSQKWVKIHESSSQELGFHEFKWDGKDENGQYVLPEGEWYLHVAVSNQTFDPQKGLIVSEEENSFFGNSFVIHKSLVPPLPTLYTYTIPLEPGVGQEFELAIYLKFAVN